MKAAQDHFEKATGAMTVPRVFMEGVCIGGNSDFQKLYVQSGRINELV
jgi:glutaredoxin